MSQSTLFSTLLELDPTWEQRTAVKTQKGAMTYGELQDASMRLAHWLSRNGCIKGARVAVCLPKTIDSVVAQLAAMLAGAAYVPVDPMAPAQRQATIANLADACRVITTPKLAVLLRDTGMALPEITEIDGIGDGTGIRSLISETPAGAPAAAHTVGGSDLAAILFTSGSTGTPKGVSLSHANILAFVDWTVTTFGFTQDDRLISHAPFHFDLSTMDLYTSFRIGSSVFLLDEIVLRFPSTISKIIESERITSWYSVPTALRLLEEKGALERRDLSQLRQIFFAGEIFPVPALRKVMAAFPNAEFINLYGPTETNVCTYYRMPGIPSTDALDIPVGIPCEHYSITIRDEHGTILGPGESGEIFVAGPGCTLGYWQRPDLTEMCRFDGREDSYRTGDFGYWLPDGNIRFQGRRDAQVKLRGYRVELMEVENVILNHPDVKEAAVVIHANGEMEAEMYAFVVPQDGTRLDAETVYSQCSRFLPHYAEPHQVVVMEDFPRTSTGKIDRQNLKSRCVQLLAADARGE